MWISDVILSPQREGSPTFGLVDVNDAHYMSWDGGKLE